jgi:hypothetical protein
LSSDTQAASTRSRRLILEWGPVLAWAGLIFWFSAQANLRFASQESLDFVIRKAGHMFVFGTLAVLIWRALASESVRWARPLAWLGTVLYAASDEFHQGFTAGRHPSPVDVTIDATGALIALVAASVALRVFRDREPVASWLRRS